MPENALINKVALHDATRWRKHTYRNQQEPDPAARQVSIAFAARMLGYSTRHIRKLCAEGKLETTGRGRGLRVLVASINRFLEENKNNSGGT